MKRNILWISLITVSLTFYALGSKAVRLKMAGFYEDKCDYAKAVRLYEKIVRKADLPFHNFFVARAGISAEDRFALVKKAADYHFQQKNKRLAIRYYRKLQALRPDDIEQYFNLYILERKPQGLVSFFLDSNRDPAGSLPAYYLDTPLWRYAWARGLALRGRGKEARAGMDILYERYPFLSEFRLNPDDDLAGKWMNAGPFAVAGIWRFDEGSGARAVDLSGNENHGIIKGASYVNGMKAKALAFDGINDEVTIPLDPSLDLDGKNFTIAMWVKPAPQNKFRFVYHKWNLNLYLTTNTNAWSFYLIDAKGDQSVHIPAPVTDDWYFIIQRARVGVDHQAWLFDQKGLVKTERREGPTSLTGSDNEPLRISRQGWSGKDNAYFKGIVDEVQIYYRALTDTEIQVLYEANRPDLHERS